MTEALSNYPAILDINEVAEILGVNRKTVKKLLDDHEIIYIKIGRIYRIPKFRLVEYLEKTA